MYIQQQERRENWGVGKSDASQSVTDTNVSLPFSLGLSLIHLLSIELAIHQCIGPPIPETNGPYKCILKTIAGTKDAAFSKDLSYLQMPLSTQSALEFLVGSHGRVGWGVRAHVCVCVHARAQNVFTLGLVILNAMYCVNRVSLTKEIMD